MRRRALVSPAERPSSSLQCRRHLAAAAAPRWQQAGEQDGERRRAAAAGDYASGDGNPSSRGNPAGATSGRASTSAIARSQAAPRPAAGTPAQPENYRVVGSSGQPTFAQDVGFPGYLWWHANDHNVNQVAFYKDSFGRVHLKGKAKCVGTTCNSASLIFQLPEGYRPSNHHIFVVLSDKTGQGAGTAIRLNVEANGWVSRQPTPLDSQNGWVSLDGMSFRAT